MSSIQGTHHRPIGWHTLRHSFASRLVAAGVPLPAVQALLGHSTITMTMRYAHLAPSTLRDAIAVLNSCSDDELLGNRWATPPTPDLPVAAYGQSIFRSTNEKSLPFLVETFSDPTGNRTRIFALKGQCPNH